jgi:hypothetical protein
LASKSAAFISEGGAIFLWRTFRQAQEIVRLFAIGHRFDVFVSPPAGRNNDINGISASGYLKRPFAAFNVGTASCCDIFQRCPP